MKSNRLSGYPLTIVDTDYFYDPNIKNPYKVRGIDGEFFKEIFSPLQPTIKILTVPPRSLSISENGSDVGLSMLKILNGTFDTRAAKLGQRVFGDFWRNELNTFISGGICYAVNAKTGTWSEYFQQSYFLHMFVSTVLVSLITETVTNYFLKHCKIEITMNLLRASIGHAIRWKPKTFLKKTVFLLVICPFIIITPYLQSELTSLIAVQPVGGTEIEKIDDLFDQKIEVFANNDHR